MAGFHDSVDIPRPPGPELTVPGPIPQAGSSLPVPHAVTREEALQRAIEHTRERASAPAPRKSGRGRVIAVIVIIVLIVLFFVLRGAFIHTGSPTSPG